MIKSGIPGLDEILKGGIVEGSSILVTGAPGTGKSIFALQFVHEGCKNNEACLYISCEESIEAIKKCAKNIGLDFEHSEKKGVMNFLREEISITKPISIAKPLQLIREKRIKRVVLDSLTFFEYASTSEIEFRKSLLEFLNAMKRVNVTVLVISQESAYDMSIIYKPQDFLFDGLILLAKIRKGSSFERCINVIKMRGQEHLMDIYPFKIEKGGIKIYTKQIPFSLK